MRDYQPGRCAEKSTSNWGGSHAHRLLLAAYTIAFMCLLHVDEVLKIQVHNIQFSGEDEPDHILILLLFCKTHQCGGLRCQSSSLCSPVLTVAHTDIPPFVLYALPKQDAHLCSIWALSAWIKASGITQGYLFCKITSGEQISNDNIPMVRLSICLFQSTNKSNPWYRQLSSFLSCFGTILSMWMWIQLPIESTLSDVVVVSTYTAFCRGACERSANGVVGAQSSLIWPLWSISSQQTTNPWWRARIFSIQTRHQPSHAMHVDESVIVDSRAIIKSIW